MQNKHNLSASPIAGHIGTEAHSVPRTYSEDELAALRLELERTLLAMNAEDERFDDVKKEHAAIIKPLKERTAELLGKLRKRGYFDEVIGFIVPDYDKGEVNVIEEDGTLIQTRRMRPEERQTTILHIPSTK